MATLPEVADYIVEQMGGAGPVSARAMFGEYGVFLDGRMVAVICDGTLFVRITDAGADFAPDLPRESPFPRAKPYFRIDADRLEDRDWLGDLIRRTAPEVPLPKKRRKGRA